MVKGVLGFRFGLCFLRLHLILAGSPFSATEKQQEDDHTTRSSSPSWPPTALTRGEGRGGGRGRCFAGYERTEAKHLRPQRPCFLRDAAQFQRKAKLFRDRFIIFPRRRRKLGPHLALFCAPTARSPTPSPTLVFIRYIALSFEAKGMYNRDNRYQFSRIIRHDRFGSIMDRRGNCVIAEIYQPTYLARGFFFSF